jgi:glycerol kinase
MAKYLIAIDQGTTSSRCIIFDKQGNIVSLAQQEFTQIFPKPGWVEHDPMEIWGTKSGVMAAALAKSGIAASQTSAKLLSRCQSPFCSPLPALGKELTGKYN